MAIEAIPIVGHSHRRAPTRRPASPCRSNSARALFSAVAFALLIVSSFNYVTMSLARAVSRAREVGLRKALGADQGSVARHYLGESIAFTFSAVLVGFALAELALPRFATAVGRNLEMGSLHSGPFLTYALAGAVVLALTVGAYPALYLARQPAVSALQGRVAGGRAVSRFSGSLVVLQFGAATGLLALVFVMLAQVEFVSKQPLGFERADRLVVFGAHYGRRQTGTKVETFKRLMTNRPGIVSVTAAGSLPNWERYLTCELRADWAPKVSPLEATYLPVGLDFTRAVESKLLAGRHFDMARGADRTYLENHDAKPDLLPVILSRRAVEHYTRDVGSMVGRTLTLETTEYAKMDVEVVGVVDDVHYRSLRQETEPMVFLPDPAAIHVYIVHFEPTQRESAIEATKGAWDRAYPDHLMAFSYMDDQMAELYEDDRQLLRLISSFGVLAVWVACIGLYGLTAFTAKRRTREIGLRKALGADRTAIMRLMLGSFSLPAVIAVGVATPIAVWLGRQWLSGFAFHVPLGPLPFVLAALVVTAVAATAVASNAWRAASVEAADALRYE